MKYLEIDDQSYLDILKMLETVMKYEEKMFDSGKENRYKDAKNLAERFRDAVRE